MALNRMSGAERPEQRPIHRLIQIGQAQLPEHFKQNQVEDGRVFEDTDKGRVEVGIVALPPEDSRSTLGKFWERVQTALEGQDAQANQLPPTPVAARPRLYADEFRRGHDVQLMAHMPYVVLEDGTRYGIVVSVPAGLQGRWEEFEGSADDGDFGFSNKIEIGQKRRGLAVVVRTEDGQALIRQDLGTGAVQSFQEMLSRGFQAVESDPSREQLMVQHRTTVKKASGLSVGEEEESKSTQEALFFSALDSNKGVGTVGDKRGRVEVVVYEVVEKQVSAIIEKPLPGMFETRGSLDGILGDDSLTRGGGTFRGGFSAGETSFGRKRRHKVNVQGVIVERPLAAFQFVLVGEMPERKLEMIVNE